MASWWSIGLEYCARPKITLPFYESNVKFKHPVHPGDHLVFKLELITPILGYMPHEGTYLCQRKLSTEGELMAQIIRKEKV